ncbi:hypothetical protein EMCRGX_G010405 [Ephydatia muelleri]
MTAVEHYIFHCKSERFHFIPKSSNESQEIVYWDNVLRSNSGRLLVRKNGRLRYTARRNVGNRIMVALKLNYSKERPEVRCYNVTINCWEVCSLINFLCFIFVNLKH